MQRELWNPRARNDRFRYLCEQLIYGHSWMPLHQPNLMPRILIDIQVSQIDLEQIINLSSHSKFVAYDHAFFQRNVRHDTSCAAF